METYPNNCRVFRIYPAQNNGGYYYIVIIFNALEDLIEWYKLQPGYDGNDNLDAVTMPYTKHFIDGNGNSQISPEIGAVLLHKNALDVPVLAHECFHCATWCYRVMNGLTEEGNTTVYLPDQACEQEETIATLMHSYLRSLRTTINGPYFY